MPDAARSALLETFRDPYLMLSADGYRELIDTAPSRGIVGGAIFDAIVAATALEAGATLLTHDRRARRTYEAVGVRWEFAG
jgi:predicted nucleic acid-binding protein